MGDDDISAINRRLDGLTTAVDTLTEGVGELKEEVVALKGWQTTRDAKEHDNAIRAAERTRWLRFVFKYGGLLARSELVRWAVVVAGVGYATL